LTGWKAYGSATIATFAPAGTVSKQTGIRVWSATATTGSIGVQTPTFPIQANKTYVCSFIARSAYSFETSFDYIYLRSGQGTTIKKLPNFVKNDFPVYDQDDNISRRVSFTFSHTADLTDANLLIGIVGTGVDGQGFVIRELQVELGSKPTSWSPSPNDLASDISTAQGTADAVTKTVDDNKTVWNRASNFRSDGNLDPDKIYGTIPDGKIAGATNWNDAKTKIDLWKYNGDVTKINGGNRNYLR
jgi:hypothetical protein